MNSSNSSNDDIITFDIPAKEGTPGYIGMFFTEFMKIGSMLTNMDGNNPTYSLERSTQFLISLVAGKQRREHIRECLKQNIARCIIEATTENETTLDSVTHKQIVDQCCLEIIGEITDFVDEHVGISIENKLGSV